MARDSTQSNINNRLRQAGIRPFRYAKDIGKALLFDSLPNQFSESLPTFQSMYDTANEAASSLHSYAAGSNFLKRGVDRMFQNETISDARNTANRLMSQLKSGKLYDAKRSQNEFTGNINDSLLNSFGGVELNFDDEGEYVETGDDTYSASIDASRDIAIAQNKADDARTTALMSSIGSSTEAQMKWNQTLTQASLQISAKFHDETMNAMKNQLTLSSAIYETMNKRLSEMHTMLAEANRSLITDVGEIKGYLKTIAKSYKPQGRSYYDSKNPLSNGFSFDAYKKQIRKNFDDSEFGMLATMLSMARMASEFDTRKKDNPILYLTDFIAGRLIPGKTRKRMERSNATMESFMTALLAKLAESGSRGNILGQLFGYKEDLKTTINTAKDLNYATQWSGKDSKALTDVIPTQLAEIISLMSGQPMRLFDYSTGKFSNAYKAAANASRDINNYTSYSDTINTLRARGRKIDFGTEAKNKEFISLIDRFLNEAITSGKNVNPYKKGFDPFAGDYSIDDEFKVAMTGLLKSLSKGELIQFGGDIQRSRYDRSANAHSVNSDLMQSSMIMAFANVGMAGLDDRDQDRLLNMIMQRTSKADKEISTREITHMIQQARRQSKISSSSHSTTKLLQDIKNILRRGVLTYSYGISNGGEGTPVPPGFDDALKDARAARRTLSRGTRLGTNMAADKTVGQVSQATRDNILREVRMKGDRLSKEKLNEYAAKLGYGSPNELIRAAEDSALYNISGGNVYAQGLSSSDIAKQLRGRNIEEEDMLQYTAEKYRDKKIGKGLSAMDRFRARISSKAEKLSSPFKLLDYAFDSLDSAMFKLIYGDIPEEDKDDSEKSVMALIRASLETQTEKFGKFLNDKLDWIDEKLFGKEGVFTKVGKWAAGKLIGTRGEDGQFAGGIFSGAANKLVGKGKAGAKDVFEGLKDQIIGVKINTSRRKMRFDGTYYTKETEYVGGLLQPLREKFEDLKTYLFGPPDKMTDSKRLASTIGKEIKGAAPSIGKGALIGSAGWLGTGLLTGMFLPGGPLLSGIIGAAAGLVNGSDKLKEYLFGVEGEDGISRGGLFSDKVQKGIKKFIPKMGKGALLGATLGNLGILPFGLGNLAGAALGSMGGMISASDQLREMLFGKPGDDESGMINKKLRTKLMGMLPGWLIGKTAGNVVWDAITNLGIIPGLSLLPGGPILGAMGGLIGAFSKEHLENFFFGKKDKDGKRDGSGIFSKMFEGVKNRLFAPIANKINKIGESINDWFKEVVVSNLKDFFSPVTELFKRGINRMKKKSMDLVDILRGAFSTVIHRTMGKWFGKLGDLLFGKKNEEGKRKGGLIRRVASAPFNALGAIGRFASRRIENSDRRFSRKQQRAWEKELRRHQKAGTAYQDENGNWHFQGEEEFFQKQQEQRERRGTGGNIWDTVETFRQRGAAAREKNKAKMDAAKAQREAAKQSPEAQATAAGVEDALNATQMAPGIATISSNTSRTNTLLEAIIQTMGGEVPGETATVNAETESGSATATSTVSGAVGNAVNNVAGRNDILRGMFRFAKKGGKLARTLFTNDPMSFNFGDHALWRGPSVPALPESADDVDGKYFKDLYQRADRAMQNAQDPRKVADEIIAQIPAKYSKEGIEIVNRVYELNQARKKEKLGGYDGGDTGLWETLKSLAGLAWNASGWLAQLLMNLLNGNGFKMPNMNMNNRQQSWGNWQNFNTSTSTSTGGMGTYFGNTPLALPSGQQPLQIGPSGNPGGLGFFDSLKTGWKSGGFKGAFNAAKSAVTNNGGLGKTIAGGAKTLLSNITKNPGKAGKAALIAAGIGTALNFAGQLSSGEDAGLFGNMWNGAKNIAGGAVSMVPTIASGALGYATSSENIMRQISSNALNKKGAMGLLAGVGSLTPAEIKTVLSGGHITDFTLNKSVGANTLNRAKDLATGAKSAVGKTFNAVKDKAGSSGLGQSLAKVATKVKDAIVGGAKKFFNSAPVKAVMGAFGKNASKIPQAIDSVLSSTLGKVLQTAAKKAGSQAAALAAKAATTVSTGGIALAVFALADFVSGMSNTNKYFGVRESDDTMGMKVASGVTKCLQGLLSNVLATTGIGIIGSIAVSLLPTGTIAQMLYKLIADEDAERELYEKQQALQSDCDAYNAENGTNYTVEEYSEKVDSNSLGKTIKNIGSTVWGGVKTVAGGVTGAVGAVASGVVNIGKTAASTIGSAASAVGKAASTGFNWLKDKLGIGKSSEEDLSGFNKWLSPVQKAMSSLMKQDSVKNTLGTSLSKISRQIDKELNNLKNTVTQETINNSTKDMDESSMADKALVSYSDGFNSAATILGVNGSDLNDIMRVCAGLGKAASDITGGLLNAKNLARSLALTATGSKKVVGSIAKGKASSVFSTIKNKISSLASSSYSTDSEDSVDSNTSSNSNKKSFGQTIKDVASAAWNGVKNAASAVGDFFSGLFGNGRGRGRYGRGEYFSQTDPRWNQVDPSMKDAGCGPTVAAMMASHYGRGKWGGRANPIEADVMADSMPGMRDSDGGTNPEFFESYGASKGINMKAGAPNKRAIESNLRSGNAVGLMGEGGAFGSNMHYMMADGIDKNGNVNIVDPYGGQAKKQPLSSITKNIDTAIYSNGSVGTSNLAADGYPMEEGSPVGMGRGRYGRSKQSNTANLTARRAIGLHGDRNAQSKASLVNKYAGAVADEKDIKPIEGSTGAFGRGRWGRGSDTANGMVYYNQGDSRWASHTTGGSSTIGASGCCISSVAMCVSTLAGKAITPDQIVDTYKSKVGILTGGSMVWSAQNSLAALFGGEVTSLSSKDQIIAALKAGKPVVMYGEKTACPACDYTDSGSRSGPHCVVLVSIDSSGKLHINDPGKRERNSKTFSTDVIRGFSQAWAWSKGGKGIVGSSSGGASQGSQADDIVAVAKAEIGYKEKASNASLDDKTANAGSGNYTKYGRDLGNQTGPGWPWCHQFVSWCAKKAGCENIIPITASCATGVAWFNQKGQYHKKSGYTPKKGDIIYFGSGGGDHVGIVTDCDGKYVYTIEGNTGSQGSSSVIAEGNAVCDKKYPLDLARIDGYGSPSYGGSTGIAGDSSGESGNEYSGVFGAFNKVFDEIQSQLDAIFAPLTGSSASTDTSTEEGDTSSGGTISGSSSDSGGTLKGGSAFPTYTGLTDAQKKFIAGVASAEQDSSDIAAQRLEVSQMANLNEVEYKKGTTGSDLMSTLKGGWYAQRSLNKANSGQYSQQALQAVEEVLVEGKRTLPRHVTEHDYYGDISNINLNPSTSEGKQNRKNMKPGDRIKNTMGSSYQFYKFAGKDGAEGYGDPFGSKDQYVKSPYTEDVPWGSGRRGRSRMDPHRMYHAGGMQQQIDAMNQSMSSARQDASISRKIDAIDTQTRAISNAASNGGFGKGGDSVAVQQIADAMTKVVELLTEIRDQGATAAEAKSSSTRKKGTNPYASQTKLNSNDPGTISMKKMAIRS